MANERDYRDEYESAVEEGPEAFEKYMIEVFSDEDIDLDEWDRETGDGYGSYGREYED